MLDEFSVGFLSGAAGACMLMAVLFIALRWMRGSSPDTLPADADRRTISDPDLRPAMIDHALEEAASLVVSHGLTAPEYRAAKARLALAVRARRGEALSDVELGVMYGVIPPPSTRNPLRNRTDTLLSH